jgi:hypothetical protein
MMRLRFLMISGVLVMVACILSGRPCPERLSRTNRSYSFNAGLFVTGIADSPVSNHCRQVAMRLGSGAKATRHARRADWELVSFLASFPSQHH